MDLFYFLHFFKIFNFIYDILQAFPLNMTSLPKIVLGAYTPTHTYQPAEVKEVIRYGEARGIRVVPEFDSPGHSTSWGDGYPEVLTQCYE